MRYYLLAAVAAAAIASPAMARDGSMYVGLEAGPMWVQSDDADYQGSTGSRDGDIRIRHKLGIDADAIASHPSAMLTGRTHRRHRSVATPIQTNTVAMTT